MPVVMPPSLSEAIGTVQAQVVERHEAVCQRGTDSHHSSVILLTRPQGLYRAKAARNVTKSVLPCFLLGKHGTFAILGRFGGGY